MEYDAIPYLPAKDLREVRDSGTKLLYIVVHSMEAPDTPNRAWNTAQYFASGSGGRLANTHFCVDDREVVRSVPDDRGCYGASGVNWNGLHIEHPGYTAGSVADWNDSYSRAVIENSAWLCSEIHKRHGIPLEYVGVQGLLDGRPGIVTHNDSTVAFKVKGGHTDPGLNFPMSRLVTLAREYTTEPEEEEMKAVLLSDTKGRVWYVVGNTKVHVKSPKHHNFLRFMGVQDLAATPNDVWVECCGELIP